MSFNLLTGHRRTVRHPDGTGIYISDADVDMADSATLTVTAIQLPPIRRVDPGENIATLAQTNPILSLKTGTHTPFTIATAGVQVTWESGAIVSGGGAWIAANNVTFTNPKITNANRGIRITASGAVITNPDIYTCGNGIFFDGVNAKGTVTGGKVYNCTRMIRNDTNSNNDFGAIGFAFDDTVGPITISGVNVYGNRVMGNAYSGAGWNYADAGVGTDAGVAMLSNDYTTNEGTSFEFWQARGITIDQCWGDNNQAVVETGKLAGGQDCQVTMRRCRWWSGTTPVGRVAKGLLLRSATSSVIEHNVLDGMDDWAILLSNTGGFPGSLSGLVMRDNITISPSAFIRKSGTPSGYTQSYNLVGGTQVWGDVTPGTGGLSADPLFVNASTNDYHLQSTSPAQNSGHDGTDRGAYP